MGFVFCLVPPSHKASADECSEGCSECLLFWGSVEVFSAACPPKLYAKADILGFFLRFGVEVLFRGSLL